jgi:hypothetical protein
MEPTTPTPTAPAAPDTDQRTLAASDSSGSEDTAEPTTACIYAIFQGKMRRIDMPMPPGLVEKLRSHVPTDDDEPVLGETDEERRQNDALIAAVTEAFSECDSKLRQLVADELIKREAEITTLYAQFPTGLYVLRTNTKVYEVQSDPKEANEETEEQEDKKEDDKTKEGEEEDKKAEEEGEGDKKKEGIRVRVDGWHDLQLFDLRKKEVASHYSDQMIADFEAMLPAQTGVRMVVLETPLVCGDIVAALRFVAYYYHHRRAVEHADKSAPVRQDKPLDSIDLVHTFFGFTLLQSRSMASSDAELGKLGQEKLQQLKAVQRAHLLRRQRMRERILERRMPTIANFTLNWFEPMLVKRVDDAEPNLPQRLYIRLQCERSGSVIDVDRSTIATERDIKERLREAEDELGEIERRMAAIEKRCNKIDKQNGKAKKKANLKAEAAAELNELREHHFNAANMIKQCKIVADRVKRCDPAEQLLLHVVDEGDYQDKGVNIDNVMIVNVPVEQMRANLAAQSPVVVDQPAKQADEPDETTAEEAEEENKAEDEPEESK